MPVPADAHFLYSVSKLPMELLEFRRYLNYKPFISRSVDVLDDPDSLFFSRGPLATILTGVVLYIIDHLPASQRWLYYWLMIFSRQQFMRQVYIAAYFEAFLLWYWPVILPLRVHCMNVSGDAIARLHVASRGIFVQEIISCWYKQLFWLCTTWLILSRYVNDVDLMSGLESLLGCAESWFMASLPVAIGVFFVDERASTNAFTPTGHEGINIASAVWIISKLPLWMQWTIWPFYSCPGARGMKVKWAICTLTWIWYGISPQAGYALFLFMNQFPQAENVLRQRGGKPSVTLRWERYGCIAYITTSIILAFMQTWFPLALWPLLLWSDWWNSKRIKVFRYKPVQQRWIRLLRLRARSVSSDIKCDLVTVSLDSPPNYIAISYRWDMSDDVQTILVDGAPFSVCKSMHSLLLAKRMFRHHVFLWIDSICIDQTNTGEKNRQVSLMRKIYEEADSTIAWLGDDPSSEKAVILARSLYQTPQVQIKYSSWLGLMKLFSNPWFERSWIIQEIAASMNPVVRCGREEIAWETLMFALSYIIAYSSSSDVLEDVLRSHRLLNVLIIENARLSVDNLNYMRLEDILKLGLVFKATLAVDKVFALLGIAEERSHLNFFAGGPNSEYWHAKNLFRELDITVSTISDITAALEGYSNSRSSQKIIRHPNRMRYAKSLKQYESQVTLELLSLVRKIKNSSEKPNIEYDVLQPEYSQRRTPASVYSLVAKTALGKGDHSIIRHAGISIERSSELEDLPSWAPDWTAELNTFVLPSFKIADDLNPVNGNRSGTDSVEASSNHNRRYSKPPSNTDSDLGDGSTRYANLYVHSIRGLVIGEIYRVMSLTEKPSFSGNVFQAAEQDFNEQVLNYNMAFTLALISRSAMYQTPEAATKAFLQTAVFIDNETQDTASQYTVNDCRLHITAKLNKRNISAALWPEKHPDHWKDHAEDSVALLKARTEICQKYILFRKMQASTHVKFAYMVKTEIMPSLSKYWWPTEDDASSNTYAQQDNTGARGLSFFTNSKDDLLSAYSRYVDYTIGRKFAVTDHGHMGLVPQGTQEGDVIIQLKNEGFVWFCGSLRLLLVLAFGRVGNILGLEELKTLRHGWMSLCIDLWENVMCMI